MAIYKLSCTNLELLVDTDEQKIVIHRTQYFEGKFPQETIINFKDLINVYNEELSFDVFNSKGTGTIKFEYPGCPEGGDIIFDALDYENMVQYKMKYSAEAKKIVDVLKKVIKNNNN